jgi:hypothetical protein
MHPSDWLTDLAGVDLLVEGAWIRIVCEMRRLGVGTLSRSTAAWAIFLGLPTRKAATALLVKIGKAGIGDVSVGGDEEVTVTSRRVTRDLVTEQRERDQTAERTRVYRGRARGGDAPVTHSSRRCDDAVTQESQSQIQKKTRTLSATRTVTAHASPLGESLVRPSLRAQDTPPPAVRRIDGGLSSIGSLLAGIARSIGETREREQACAPPHAIARHESAQRSISTPQRACGPPRAPYAIRDPIALAVRAWRFGKSPAGAGTHGLHVALRAAAHAIREGREQLRLFWHLLATPLRAWCRTADDDQATAWMRLVRVRVA